MLEEKKPVMCFELCQDADLLHQTNENQSGVFQNIFRSKHTFSSLLTVSVSV